MAWGNRRQRESSRPLPAGSSAPTARRDLVWRINAQPRESHQRRRLSKSDLSVDAEVSTRHLSFVATDRAVPSREIVLRLSLHPKGLAPGIVNLGQSNTYLIARPRQQLAVSADPVRAALADELRAYPARAGSPAEPIEAAVVLPLVLHTPAGTRSFISTTTVFGTPVDIILSELALETLFCADAATTQALRAALDG